MALALFVFLAVAAFDRLTERATWGRLAAAGLATGAALATKFSGLVLGPVLLVLGAVAVLGGKRLSSPPSSVPSASGRGVARRTAGCWRSSLGIAALALLVVWACYGFRGALSPDAAVRAARARGARGARRSGPGSGRSWRAADIGLRPRGLRPRTPLRDGALRGPTRPSCWAELSDHGFPHYFLVTFLLKTPIPLLLLILLALAPRPAAAAAHRGLPVGSRRSSTSASPSAGASRSATATCSRSCPSSSWPPARRRRPSPGGGGRPGSTLVALLGAWYAVGTLANHPHHLAYFNEIGGGPTRGWRLLVDSNLDWGQDLKRLKTWMDAQGVAQIKLSYFGSASPSYYGIHCRAPPRLLGAPPAPGHPRDPSRRRRRGERHQPAGRVPRPRRTVPSWSACGASSRVGRVGRSILDLPGRLRAGPPTGTAPQTTQ